MAIAVIAGVAILVGAFVRPVRWLVLQAVTLAISAGAVSAGRHRPRRRRGRARLPPLVGRGHAHDTYQLGMPVELVVDLRQTDLPSGDVPLGIDLGVGEARLIVPDDVCVATDAQVGIGEVRTFERHNEGVDVDVEDLPDAPADTTRLLVNADVGVGSLRIGKAFADLNLDHGASTATSTTSGAMRPVRRGRPTSLVAGIAVLALGVLLLLDARTRSSSASGSWVSGVRRYRSDPAGVGDDPAAMIYA